MNNLIEYWRSVVKPQTIPEVVYLEDGGGVFFGVVSNLKDKPMLDELHKVD